MDINLSSVLLQYGMQQQLKQGRRTLTGLESPYKFVPFKGRIVIKPRLYGPIPEHRLH